MIENHNTVFRPLVGGIAIRNATVGQKGTLGLVATADGVDRWIVSCYHVLCRNGSTMPPNAVEDIVQPRVSVASPVVAQITSDRVSQTLDCAAALILTPPSGIGRIYGIGRLSAPSMPVLNRRVLKSGAETGVTEGVIKRLIGDDVEIEPLWPDHVICGPGDSGSIWVDAETMSPVVLNCETLNPGRRASGKVLLSVMAELHLQMVID